MFIPKHAYVRVVKQGYSWGSRGIALHLQRTIIV